MTDDGSADEDPTGSADGDPTGAPRAAEPHEEVRDLLALIESMDVPEINEVPPEQARAVFEGALAGGEPAAAVGAVEEGTVPGPDGDLQVRIYQPEQATIAEHWGGGPPPTVVFFHGGGFVIGSLETHDDTCRVLCARSGCLVVSVGYRLAPEHPFPAAVLDAYHATAHLASAAVELGGDPDRLAVAGDSAGGNLAAVVALLARDRAALDDRFFAELPPAPAIAHQALLYPAVSYGREWPSMAANADGYFLTLADLEYFVGHYYPDPLAGFNRYAAPLSADDHAGLPPATVVTAGFDPLHDEGVAYARALADAGVPVELRDHPDMIHGFASFLGQFEISRARDVLDAVAGDLRASLGG